VNTTFVLILPELWQAETYEGPTFNDSHGTSGPIKVSFAHSEANVGEEFLNVAAAFDKSRPCISDLNDFHTSNGYAVCTEPLLENWK
jgi:alcohol oxidase